VGVSARYSPPPESTTHAGIRTLPTGETATGGLR
jgi:hypothetical protein